MPLQHREGGVLVGLHYLALSWSLVVDAAKVEYAMDDDAVKLIVVGFAKLLSVGTHGVEGNHNVTIDYIVFIVVESDDVSLIVVTEILAIDLEYLLVVYKHIAHLSNLAAMSRSHALDPGRGVAVTYLRHLHAVCIVCYHNIELFMFYIACGLGSILLASSSL